jgi:hypothetical protein
VNGTLDARYRVRRYSAVTIPQPPPEHEPGPDEPVNEPPPEEYPVVQDPDYRAPGIDEPPLELPREEG